MFMRLFLISVLIVAIAATAEASSAGASRDILVTFENVGASRATTSGGGAYRFRKRYAVSAEVRRNATSVAREYALVEVDHWPIKSLSVYCFVYRIPDGSDREAVINRLQNDARVESVQALNEFESASNEIAENYDDTYANLQHGLNLLDIFIAHRHTTGSGIRVAIIDSQADTDHEDLRGRVRKVANFAASEKLHEAEHGTAVASVIGANANNALGIVGVAPDAAVDVFVSCWEDATTSNAVCNSFTLAKALDALLESPPDVLNLSLTGPSDALVQRLLDKVHAAGVIIVAACAESLGTQNHFPASMASVIGVSSSIDSTGARNGVDTEVYAPGNQILVAVPDNEYDFRSGSSLAAAHVSGVVALLLAVSPDLSSERVRELLRASQLQGSDAVVTVNACAVLHLDDASRACD